MNRKTTNDQTPWEAVVQHVLDAILLVNNEGRFIAANPAACALLGYEHAELLKLTVLDITPGPYLEQLREFGRILLEHGRVEGNYVVQRKDRATVEVKYRAVANITPGVHLSIIRDISERKRMEGALHQSEEKFAAFMEHLPAFAWMKGLDGRYIFLNKLCQETAYRDCPEYLGRTDDEIWPALVAALYKQNDQQVVATRRSVQAVEMFTQDGELRHTIVSKFPILNEHGQPVMIGGVGLDITEWKRAEERQHILFKELQAANEQLHHLAGRVLAVQEEERQRISRELHDESAQALTALKMILQRVEEELPDTLSAQRENLNKAIALTDSTMTGIRLLTQDLRPPSLDALTLSQSLEGLCLEFRQRSGLAIEFTGEELPPQPPEVNVCFYRVLQEALTNVIKHAQASRVRVGWKCENNRLILKVEDNGIGFEKGLAVRTAKASSGLGLVGMQERLGLLRGGLQVDSVPGAQLMGWIPLAR